MPRDGWANVQFRLQGSTDEATEEIRERVGEMLAGRRVRDMSGWRPKVLAGVLPRLYPQMLDVAYAHQDAGRPVFICTAASQEMADMLAYVLGFDGALGRRARRWSTASTPAGSRGRSPTARARPQAMSELAASEGIDLAASWAYSDSESDLPMLRAVGPPGGRQPRRRARAGRARRRAGRSCASRSSAGG